MDVRDAAALIREAIPAPAPGTSAPRTWADLGAGSGTFTRALGALLGDGARIHAVDRDPGAALALTRLARGARDADVVAHRADFADAAAWRALGLPPLDGILLANALHFVPAAEQAAVLARLAASLAPGGRLVVVEYEGRRPGRWVPVPVPLDRLVEILPPSLDPPRRVGERPSAYGGTMYAAVAARRGAAT